MRRTLAWIAALFALCGDLPARAADPVKHRAAEWMHFLRYVGADYGATVSEGAVLSREEYEEQLELIESADRLAGSLATEDLPTRRHVRAAQATSHLQYLIRRKAPGAEVAREAEETALLVAAAFGVPRAPDRPPSLERGRGLFEANCATCHGPDGRAETEKAKTLSPPPMSFLDPQRADDRTAWGVFNTLRFGVPETAMAAFDALSEEERWDLAFYVLSLRHAAPPAPCDLRVSLATLATRSDRRFRADIALREPSPAESACLAHLRRQALSGSLEAARSPREELIDRVSAARRHLARGAAPEARGALADAYSAALAIALAPTAEDRLDASFRAAEQDLSEVSLRALEAEIRAQTEGSTPKSTSLLAACGLLFLGAIAAGIRRPKWRVAAGIAAASAAAFGFFFGWPDDRRDAETRQGPTRTGTLTIHLEAPGPVRQGYARIWVDGEERMARFEGTNLAVFPNMPVSGPARASRVEILTAPEYEAMWEPARRFRLDTDDLTVFGWPEKRPYDVVYLDTGAGGAPGALLLQGFGPGAEVTAKGFAESALKALRVGHPDAQLSEKVRVASVATRRWLRPSAEMEHLGDDETSIVLVAEALLSPGQDDPGTYVDRAGSTFELISPRQ